MQRASYIIAGYVNRNRDELQRSRDYVAILNYNKNTILKKAINETLFLPSAMQLVIVSKNCQNILHS